MGKKDVYFLIVLLAGLTLGFAICLDYPYRARFFPLIVISLCGLLVAAELLQALAAVLGSKLGESGAAPGRAAPPAGDQQRWRFFFATLWIGIFALLLWLLGFIVGLPLFLMAYVKMHGEKWRWALILPAVMFVIVYVGFGLLLKSPLYEGFLFLL